MLRSKPLPPIHPVSSTKDLEAESLLLDNTRHPSISYRAAGVLEAPMGCMNRPVLRTLRRSTLLKPTARPEDGVAALSASLSTRYPLRQDIGTNDFKRSRTRYTTNATLVDRAKPKDVQTERADVHKRNSNRRKKDAALSINRGGNLSFPPGKVIKRNDDNLIIPQMFPKVRRVDRGGPCPTQLYTKTKVSYSGRINGSVQLDHQVRKNSRPRIEPLRVPSTSTGTGTPARGDDSLGSVISSSKMTLEGRMPDTRTDRERQVRGLSPLFRQYSYCDDELSVPPNSEIGPSRMQVLTPYEP